MSDITLFKTLAGSPTVERGFAYQFYGNTKKGAKMTYTNGKSVFIRSLEDPSEATVFVGEHKENVNVAVLSPNGEWCASGDKAGRLLVWGQGNQNIKSDFPINKDVLDIAWSGDGQRIVAVGNGSEAMAKCIAWDTGANVGSVSGHIKKILSCDFRAERPMRIICGGEDFRTSIHEGPPFKELKFMNDSTNYVNKCKFSPDGAKFITVSSDMSIIAYDGKTGDLIKKIESKTVPNGHTGAIYSFAWSPDSTKFVTCGADKTAKLWNYESGTVEQTFSFGKDIDDMQHAVMWVGDYLCTVSLSGAINYLDTSNPGVPKRVVVGHQSQVAAVAVNRASQHIYSADRKGVVCVWKNYNASWFSGVGHGKAIIDAALNSDGSKFVTVGLDDKLRFNDCKEEAFSTDAIVIGGAPSSLTCGQNSPGLAAVGLAQDKVVLIVGEKNVLTKPINAKPLSLAFSPDDSKLAVGTAKGNVIVFNVSGSTLSEAYELKNHERPIARVAWSPCGTYLVTSATDKRILVQQGDKILNKSEWEFHDGSITDLAFSPSGKKVASVASDLSVFVWTDTTAWGTAKKAIKMAHREGIFKVAWVTEDLLLTVGADSCIKIWKA